MADPADARRRACWRTVRGIAGGAVLAFIAAAAVSVLISRERGFVPLEPVTPPPIAVPEEDSSDGEEVEQVQSLPPTPAPREPTEADAAAFAASFEPPRAEQVEMVIVDLDQDDRSEVVVASIVDGVARIDVARWDGEGYEVAFTGRGGPAEVIEEFAVRDVTGDGTREIVVQQRAPERRSLGLWGVTDEGIARQEAHGGCWDGSHVFGVQGAEVASGELIATCDPERGEVPPGGSQRYVWDGEAWNAELAEEPIDSAT